MNRKVIFLVIPILLIVIICVLVATCDGGTKPPIPDESVAVKNPVFNDTLSLKNINVYIESSGSMDGFVNYKDGLPTFNFAIQNLITQLKSYASSKNAILKLYFICNVKKGNDEELSTSDISDNISNFSSKISVTWSNQKGRGSNTDINEIFGQILQSTDSNTVSILISDCIYSIGKRGNALSGLSDQKYATKDHFTYKLKENENFSTTVARMKAPFDGRYYPYTGDSNRFDVNDSLSYYICFLGDWSLLSSLNKKIDIEKIEGFENKYDFPQIVIDSKKLDYTVLVQSAKLKGDAKYKGANNNKGVYHGIEKVSIDKKKEMEIAVAINISSLSVESQYLLNKDNYSVSYYDDDDLFKVKKVSPIKNMKSNIHHAEWDRIKGVKPTHIILLQSVKDIYKSMPQNKKDFRTLTIALKNQQPEWIKMYSIIDDTDPSKLYGGKSFGLEYWMDGISEAFKDYYDNENYFEISIVVNE